MSVNAVKLDDRPMRVARRDFTRARICAAAREVFFVKGYAAATLEDIAQAAGTRRSTLYNHFRDKNDVLAVIAEDYLAMVEIEVARLKGPRPSRAEIDAWIAGFARFVVAERTPTILVVHGSAEREIPQALLAFGVKLIEAFAAQLPAFAAALRPDAEGRLALVRARAVLRELGYALCTHVEEEGGGLAPEMLTVAGELFERFVHEQA
jgi:AcrR family transcriptional regulator